MAGSQAKPLCVGWAGVVSAGVCDGFAAGCVREVLTVGLVCPGHEAWVLCPAECVCVGCSECSKREREWEWF